MFKNSVMSLHLSQVLRKNRPWFRLTMSIFFLCVTTNTIAATQQDFILPLTFEHESNPSLTVTDEQSINRVILVPDYSLLINQGTVQWSANASLRIERSSDQMISEDRNDPTLSLGWRHTYETGQFGITALLNNQSTRITEFVASGQQVSGDNTQKNRMVSVDWLNALSDRTSLILNGSVTNMTFDGLNTTGLVDYRNESVTARLSYTFNEQMETFTQLFFSTFEPGDINSIHSETKGFNLGLTWNVNEKLNMTTSAGTSYTISKSNVQNATTNKSWQAMLNLQYNTLLNTSYLSFSRSLIPGSSGSINETNQIEAGWTYSLSDRDNIGFNISRGQNLTLNNIETNSFSVNYARQISLSWDLRLAATHRNIDNNLSNVSSNNVMASIIYNLSDF